MSSRWKLVASCLVAVLPGALPALGASRSQPVKPKDGPLGMKFVPLPKGTFYMEGRGGKAGKKTEIKEDFEIGVYAVTQGQWQAVMGNNPSWFSRKGNGREAVLDISDEELKLFPVETVSWDDAQEFIKKLNEKERGRGYLYRLPTEAEWEYACRGGATSEEECSYHFYFARPSNDLSSEQANFNGNYPFANAPKGKYLGRPTRVGAYPSNKLGLCDMHGNVCQWCADLFVGGARTGWSGAAAGAAAAPTAGRRSAAGARRRSGAASWASVLPEFPCGSQAGGCHHALVGSDGGSGLALAEGPWRHPEQ
jgi:formylglycine-generating enzyme required for sulfatase activity